MLQVLKIEFIFNCYTRYPLILFFADIQEENLVLRNTSCRWKEEKLVAKSSRYYMYVVVARGIINTSLLVKKILLS